MKKALFATIATLLMVACVNDPMDNPQEQSVPQSKIVNPSATPAEGLLIVRITDGAELPSFSDIAGIAIEARDLFPRSAHREP